MRAPRQTHCSADLVSRDVKLSEDLLCCSAIEVEQETEILKLIGRYVIAAVGIQQLEHRARVSVDKLLLLFILQTGIKLNRLFILILSFWILSFPTPVSLHFSKPDSLARR